VVGRHDREPCQRGQVVILTSRRHPAQTCTASTSTAES
jgi:hypothetical protein